MILVRYYRFFGLVMKRCLVIEDELNTSRFICQALQVAGYEAVPCHNGLDGARLALESHWDIIILDRMLPGQVDGLSVLERLRAHKNHTPVLILSALGSTDERVRGLRSGGDDYLSKPFALDELLARVEALLRRQLAVPSPVLQVADLVLDTRHQRVTRAGQTITLQPREFRLLEYLMRHAGQVVTRTMLLESVWDYHFDPQTNVIDVQMSRLRTKVDKDFSLPLIQTVRGIGYLFSASDQHV
jgi:two-component system OmpR family response regulator